MALRIAQSIKHRYYIWGIIAVGILILLGSIGYAWQQVQAADSDLVVDLSQETGTAPFDGAAGPGNDTTPADDIVRSYDSVRYIVTIGLAAGIESASNVTITQTAPAGMTWKSLPAYCLTDGVTPTSSIVGQVITCNVGTVNADSASQYGLVASVSGLPNGTVITPATDSLVVTATLPDTTTATQTRTPDPVTVSSTPRINFKKTLVHTAFGYEDASDNPGTILRYALSLDIPEYNTKGLRGYYTPTPDVDQTVIFIDDFSGMPAGSRLALATDRLASNNAPYTLPDCTEQLVVSGGYPRTSGGGPEGVTNSGTWTCNTVGSTVEFEISSADLTASHVPTKNANGTALPANEGYLAVGEVSFFIPTDSLNPSGSTPVVNTISTFEVNDPGSGSTPIPGDNPTDDTASTSLYREANGGGVGERFRYTDLVSHNNISLPVPGATSQNAGDGHVRAGQNYQGMTIISNGSVSPLAGIVACQIVDSAVEQVAANPALAGKYANPSGVPVWYGGAGAGDFIIEYTTDDPVSGADADRWAEMKSRGCGDGDATWSTTMPSDLSTITRIRMVQQPSFEIQPGNSVELLVNYQPRSSDQNGQVISTMSRIFHSGTWTTIPGGYNPAAEPYLTTSLADRVTYTLAQTSVIQTAINPLANPEGSPVTILSGNSATIRITPDITTIANLPDVVAHDVTITVRLPKGVRYSTTTPASIPPLSVEIQPDGSTLIAWHFDEMGEGNEPTIDYTVDTLPTSVGDYVSEVIIQSPDDSGSPSGFTGLSVDDPHYSPQTLVLEAPGGVEIAKLPSVSEIEANDSFHYEVIYANMNNTVLANIDVIDILPYDGDGRGTTETGGYPTLTSVTVSDGETVRYTDAAPVSINQDTGSGGAGSYGTLSGGEAWCIEADFGTANCPTSLEEATAVRVTRNSDLGGLQNRSIILNFQAEGGLRDDAYANDATVRTSSITIGARSTTVTIPVVVSSIGSVVWMDDNKNGLLDPGEQGVDGIAVQLAGTDKDGLSVSRQTTTANQGQYLFDNLVSGTYEVTFVAPAGDMFTLQNVSGGTASVANPTTGLSGMITLAPGTDLLTINAGLIPQPGAPNTGFVTSQLPSLLLAAGLGSLAMLIAGAITWRILRRRSAL